MACASTLHVLIKKGVTYEITSHNMNCSTQTWRRWSYATAMDAVALIMRAPWTKPPNAGVLLAVSPMKELMWKQANSLWRSVKQSIKGVKARQWQSQRARPFWRTICFILQETMWVFPTLSLLKSRKITWLPFHLMSPCFYPRPTQVHHLSKGMEFFFF